MSPTTLTQIVAFAGGTLTGKGEAKITRINTDSRILRSGDLFVALRGDNFDGHRFVESAAKRGAVAVLVEHNWRGDIPLSLGVIRVDDTLAAYQKIAAGYRRSLPLKVIAITGSNGKTTTKDFLAAALGRRFNVTKTEGNFNNHVGLPRTMLEAKAEDEIAVWEIGMNHPGEIAALAALAAPDVAVITNVGIAHIEFMGTREAIAWEKGSLAEVIGPEGTVVLNADDPFSSTIAERTRAKIVLAGTNGGSVCATDISQSATGSEFTILEGAHRCRAQLPVPGLHMVQNALLAIAAGRVFGVSIEDCAAGLASAPLTKARLQIKNIHGVQFLDDSYNANPESVKAALATLVELETDGRRIAVLGPMSELGAESERGHREVGEAAAALKIDQLITIGETGAVIARSARDAGLENSIAVASAGEAADLLAETASAGDLILVKGSRSARTEQVIEQFGIRHSAFVTSP
ncbi:MAG: UDP-N-acetylmuramoyl-tripeptide--D-alanyl-D-alanine ligase [Verrucomicrobiota bacterium]